MNYYDFDLQKMSAPMLLKLIRDGEVTYSQVDKALEKVKKFSTLDWIGDQLAKDELKGKEYDKASEMKEAKKAKTSDASFFDAIAAYQEKLKGGKGHGKSPYDFDLKQLRMGYDVEAEHTADPVTRIEIAMDHLDEFPSYYSALDKMEKSLQKPKKESEESVEEAKKKRRRKMALGPFYGKMGGKSAATMPPFRSSGEGVNPTSPGPAHPGAGGINAPGVPGGANTGMGPA